MNQLCKVCSEPAAGFHFGAFTCEGCKSFFGRTYNNVSAIAGCKNNGDCEINKKNRTTCKACRLRKCLLVGMSKSGSRYGRRSNWFKIHCLLQEQQSSASSTSIGASALGVHNLEHLSRLQQTSSQARQTYQDKTNPCIKSAAIQSVALQSTPMPTPTTTSAMTVNSANVNMKSETSEPHHLLSLPNYLQVANKLHHDAVHGDQHLKVEHRLCKTPSHHSDASSAGDPVDETSCLTAATTATTISEKAKTVASLHRNCNSVNPILESCADYERRHRELLEIFRSHSEPLSSHFVTFALPSSLLSSTPPTHLVPPPPAIATVASAFIEKFKMTTTPLAVNSDVQDQPIDLSFKSRRPTKSRTSPSHSSPPTSPVLCREEIPAFVGKSTPLDLTAVHSKTLTG